MLIFQGFLPAREPSVATFSEARVVTSPRYMVKPGMKISKVWEKHKSFWSQVSVAAFLVLIFECFLSLKWQMAATFNETSAITSKIYVVKQGMDSSKFFKSYEFFVLSSSLKNVNSCK